MIIWYCCRDCGKDVEVSFNAGGNLILCEECYERQESEVENAWQKTLRRANEN